MNRNSLRHPLVRMRDKQNHKQNSHPNPLLRMQNKHNHKKIFTALLATYLLITYRYLLTTYRETHGTHVNQCDLPGKNNPQTVHAYVRGGDTSILVAVSSSRGAYSSPMGMVRSSDPEGIHLLSSPLTLPDRTALDVLSDNCCTGTFLDFPVVWGTDTTGHRHGICFDRFMRSW